MPEVRRSAAGYGRVLFLAVPFLSAVLLFQSELLLAKYILPWFGGTPNVWSVSMLFFQVALLAGYAYAHGVATRLQPARQARLHVGLLAAAVLALLLQAAFWRCPLLADTVFRPEGSDLPGLRILGILAISVGLPFLVLSTTTSLLQSWYSRAFPARSPYPLFAVSNAGSFVGLLSYPFLVEPFCGLRSQAMFWTAGFVLFAIGCGVLALRQARQPAGAGADVDAAPAADASTPPAARRLLWVLLAAVPSILLLASTNQLANDVPVIPFLWAVPLAIYLLTFILAFAHRACYSRPVFVLAGLVLMVLVGRETCHPIVHGSAIVGRMLTYDLALFVACMLCHGELARVRPAPAHLTSYYLWIAVGGAIGGLFVGLLAPVLFADLWELYLGYLLCGFGVLIVAAGDARSRLHHPRWGRPLQVAAGIVLLLLAVGPLLLLGERAPRFCRTALQPLAQALGLDKSGGVSRVMVSRRNFYGVLRVQDVDLTPRMRILRHGQTVHGFQFLGSPEQRRETSAYYTTNSGIGRALLSHPLNHNPPGPGMRVGAIGLGVGTLAAYGRPGDCYRFYEINPAVIELATGAEHGFSFLGDSRASVEIVSGDARISLEREPSQQFDVLAVDAFSGDSVPAHLLTREAMALYLRHVRPDGIIAFHVSSRHLDLPTLVRKLADTLQLHAVCIDQPVTRDWIIASRWVLVFRDPAVAQRPGLADAPTVTPDPAALARVRAWTDDCSDLYHVLKR
jgi:SAM-dependent methyltransferase